MRLGAEVSEHGFVGVRRSAIPAFTCPIRGSSVNTGTRTTVQSSPLERARSTVRNISEYYIDSINYIDNIE